MQKPSQSASAASRERPAPAAAAPLSPPFVLLFAQQKSGGKTLCATFVADALTINDTPLEAYQIDDQRRLQQMIGDVVHDLRPNPDLIADDPTIVTRAFTPLYDAARRASQTRGVVLVDTGAGEVENLSNFLRDVGYAEDTEAWGLPTIACVPFLPVDPESSAQAAFTVRRLKEAAPNIRIVLVENRHGGAVERIVRGSLAEASYNDLVAVAKGAERIVMPAMPREYWGPFEGAGMRFLKVLALDPQEGAAQFNRSVGEVKIAKAAVARFWRAMHAQMARLIALPIGGA